MNGKNGVFHRQKILSETLKSLNNFNNKNLK